MRRALIAILLVAALPTTALAGRKRADKSKNLNSVTRQLEDAKKKVQQDVKKSDLQKKANDASAAAQREADKLKKK